jgi:PAS domain S-box-containing protein
MTVELEDLKAMWLELKARVELLAGERHQFMDFFEQSPEAYVVTDALGMIADLNGAAVDVFQRRKRYLRGKPMAVLVALEQRAEFRRRLRSIVEGRRQAPWLATLLSPEARTEARLSARRIGAPGESGGICWLLQPAT